jgi:hypothetical protein
MKGDVIASPLLPRPKSHCGEIEDINGPNLRMSNEISIEELLNNNKETQEMDLQN